MPVPMALPVVRDAATLTSSSRWVAVPLQVFRFCAIPQVMAMGTLALCYNNYEVFTGLFSGKGCIWQGGRGTVR